MNQAVKIMLCILIGLMLTGCREQKQATEIANKAPDFSGTDLDGKKVSLSDFKGKVVLLDFWATWCPPCRNEIPHLQKIYSEYKNKGMVVIGASSEGIDQIRKFKEEVAISYPLLKVDSEVFSAYQVRGIPTTYILDSKGYVRHHQVGYAPERGIEQEFRRAIQELLGESKESR